jgi:antirestriction protein ArdC
MLVQAAAQAQRAADYLQNLHPATDTEDRRAQAATPGAG